MEKMIKSDRWQDAFLDVWESTPESDEFKAEIADKQIEGIFEMVHIMADQLNYQEDLIIRLMKVIKTFTGNVDLEEGAISAIPPNVHETMYL